MTTTKRENSLFSKSKIQEQLDKILSEQSSLIKQLKSNNNTKTSNKATDYYTTSAFRTTKLVVPSQTSFLTPFNSQIQTQPLTFQQQQQQQQQTVVNEPQSSFTPNNNRVPVTSSSKIQHLLFNFDYIDPKKNHIEVLTSDTQSILYARIINRTDIFKGVNGGAIYLHSKTSLYLNLNNHSSHLCLTSLTDSLIDPVCANGWTISFWIKVKRLLNL